MPIAFDAVGTGDNGAGGTAGTIAHTNNGNILWVNFQSQLTNDAIGTVTYAGGTMTRAGIGSASNAGGTTTGYLYYLASPATGANNLIWYQNTSGQIRGVSASYSGAATTGIPDAIGTFFNGTTTSLSGTITTGIDNCWLVSGLSNDAAAGTGGANTTTRGTAVASFLGDSNAVQTPAGAGSQTWNMPLARALLFIASFAPSEQPPAPTVPSFKSLTGVGM